VAGDFTSQFAGAGVESGFPFSTMNTPMTLLGTVPVFLPSCTAPAGINAASPGL
jgi:hypothetical protein